MSYTTATCITWFTCGNIHTSGVARPVKLGGQAVGNAVFQVGKELWR